MRFLKRALVFLLAVLMIAATVSCDKPENPSTDPNPEPKEPKENVYDFYITLGTMPTLYATISAYQNQNPNTYMWFYRGNTISKQYSADFIHYFDTQSNDNSYSNVCWSMIRDKVKAIKAADPNAKFHLYCDDLRVSFIPHIFVYAGVDFADLDVTLLSDGTATYSNYAAISDEYYNNCKAEWEDILKKYTDGRGNPNFEPLYSDHDNLMMQLQNLAFYVSTFENVDYWIQTPEYLKSGEGSAIAAATKDMHIVKKNPAEMYNNLPTEAKSAYQKVVLANALVDSTTLNTLEDAVAYFDSKLDNRDKEVVLILGSSDNTLEGEDAVGKLGNKYYIDKTIDFYTPTLDASDSTKVLYKGKEYTVSAGATTVNVDGKDLTIGELGVYLFFKGHPSYPANATLAQYFADNGIEILPHRTPVEALFWMYEVKVGGYQSTSYLSCNKGQTEFLYEQPTTAAIVHMKNIGFFDGVAVFERPTE